MRKISKTLLFLLLAAFAGLCLAACNEEEHRQEEPHWQLSAKITPSVQAGETYSVEQEYTIVLELGGGVPTSHGGLYAEYNLSSCKIEFEYSEELFRITEKNEYDDSLMAYYTLKALQPCTDETITVTVDAGKTGLFTKTLTVSFS